MIVQGSTEVARWQSTVESRNPVEAVGIKVIGRGGVLPFIEWVTPALSVTKSAATVEVTPPEFVMTNPRSRAGPVPLANNMAETSRFSCREACWFATRAF